MALSAKAREILKMRQAEAKETPAMEKKESPATQAKEQRLGVEKHCPKCGKTMGACSCK